MTIKRQRVNAGALVEVEADNTDTVDTNGFSDPIQVVGAKTAKFSGGATMQANSGLRIGLTQVKINGGAEIVRTRNIESNVGWTNPNDAIDNNINTRAIGQAVGNVLIIDFESIDTQNLNTVLGNTFVGGSDECVIRVEISNDNISYSLIGNFVQFQNTKTTRDHGSQTWRYVRLTFVSQTGSSTPGIFRVFENAPSSSVTVRIRSSTTIDTADGTVIVTDTVINPSSVTTLDTDLLLTGNNEFVTLEIVSTSGIPITITLSEITSIKEEP